MSVVFELPEYQSSSSSSEDSSSEESFPYDPTTTYHIDVEYDLNPQPKYDPIFLIDEITKFGPSFELPNNIHPNPATLAELWLPDHLLERWVKATNDYAAAHLPINKRRNISKADILRFLATISYMGLCRLPAKKDYFPGKRSDVLPSHPLIKIKRVVFDYLWRYFHTSYTHGQQEDETDVDMEDEDDEEIIDESIPDLEEEDDYNQQQQEAEVEDDDDDEPQPEPSWYNAIEDFIEHVNKVSKKLCKHPGWAVVIDEMLRKFMGRSAQTHRMKRKPDKEGYKFFALACSLSGYCYSFFPSGRQDKTTTKESVEKLVSSLPRRDHLKYVLVMDNFFNQPTTIEMIRGYGVGSIGTVRRQRNWPPKEYKRIKDNRYNTLYSFVDKRNFLLQRWVDNDEVDMCTTVHEGIETVLRQRKRPRENQFNRRNVRAVWGSSWCANIVIPQVIDDYNKYMGGVDKAYQLISNYKPKLRCRRTWMPMFLHALDVCRLNSYIISKQKEACSNQKDFLIEWITSMNDRADFIERQRTRSAAAALLSPPPIEQKGKRSRMKKHEPELPHYRFHGKKEDHVAVITTKQLCCTYCKYLRAKAKADGTTPLPSICRPARACLACNDHLCSIHFDLFHRR